MRNRKFNYGFWVLAFVFLFQLRAFSQQYWSLDSCINYALNNNIEIELSDLQTKLSQYNEKFVILSSLPTINSDFAQSFSYGGTINPFTNTREQNNRRSNNASIVCSLSLFDGLSQYYSIKMERVNSVMNGINQEITKNQVTQTIIYLYYDVLLSKEMIIISENNLQQSRLELDYVRRLVSLDKELKSKILEAETALLEDQQHLMNNKFDFKRKKLSLLLALNLDPEMDFLFSSINELPNILEKGYVKKSFEEGLMKLVKDQPEVRLALAQIELADYDLKMSKKGFLPKLNFNYMYNTFYSHQQGEPDVLTDFLGNVTDANYGIFDQFIDNQSHFVQFQLQIPIFNGYTAKHNINRSSVKAKMAQLNYQSSVNETLKKITSLFYDTELMFEKLIGSQKQAEAYKALYASALNKYKTKDITSYELESVKGKYVNSQTQYTKEKYEYISNLEILKKHTQIRAFYQNEKSLNFWNKFLELK